MKLAINGLGDTVSMNRRELLRRSAMAALVPTFLGGTRIVSAAQALEPVNDLETGLPLLKLPSGFTYRSMSWTGDAQRDGSPVPDRHDGMGIVNGANADEKVLLRNQERSYGSPIVGEDVSTYDGFSVPPDIHRRIGSPLGIVGGVTGVVLNKGRYKETVPLLGGTMINCAGGQTPWGTWLTCEEIVFRGSNLKLPDGSSARDHGYVFEVPPPHMGKASAIPIKDMGFFRHEAVAIDPETSDAYLTEDNGPHSGFFKFVPNDTSGTLGSLDKGGSLYMLKVKGQDRVDLTRTTSGNTFDVEWVPISNPDSDPEILNSYGDGLENLFGGGRSGPYLEGEKLGGAKFARGEGIWEFERRMYWVDTGGGPAGVGSVWVYDPASSQLACVFASESEAEADAIDNITVNHTNGMYVLCEDGGGVMNPDGSLVFGSRLLLGNPSKTTVSAIAENNLNLVDGVPDRPLIATNDYRGSEWAGAVFSEDGKTLYANIQRPGITFAIEGPWASL